MVLTLWCLWSRPVGGLPPSQRSPALAVPHCMVTGAPFSLPPGEPPLQGLEGPGLGLSCQWLPRLPGNRKNEHMMVPSKGGRGRPGGARLPGMEGVSFRGGQHGWKEPQGQKPGVRKATPAHSGWRPRGACGRERMSSCFPDEEAEDERPTKRCAWQGPGSPEPSPPASCRRTGSRLCPSRETHADFRKREERA